MTFTSKKHGQLVDQPLGKVKLNELPAIGPAISKAIEQDFPNAISLWEHFHNDHQCKKNSFIGYMNLNYSMRLDRAKALANFFQEWESNRLDRSSP